MTPGGLLIPASDRNNCRGPCTTWRLAARCAPPGGERKIVALERRWRLAVSMYRQAVWNDFAWRRVAEPGENVVVPVLFYLVFEL